MAKPTRKDIGRVATTGHSWDGIEEFDNPMPRWWVWVFYLTIAFAIGYTIAYPAWPLLKGATPGLLGHSTRADVAAEIQRIDDANAPVKAALEQADLAMVSDDPGLKQYATNAGAAVFKTWCAQCHGAGAAGVQKLGYPNLLDDDWIWGGDINSIHTTISHGVRNTTDADARYGQMAAYGVDELLEPQQIDEVVNFVLQISGQEHDATLAAAGATVFADNCVACHGESGSGDREQGAPNLTDAIWLYGGTPDAIKHTVTYGRFGVMPAWAGRLSEDEIRSVAVYIHGLGGGE
jgi:cytochrome c oxidase cbb3-type subunit 3